jgi:predicted ATPase
MSFHSARGDQSDRLLIPEKLYGRDREIATLLAAFDAAVASAKPQLVLVSGYSGIGKSSLVGELHRALVPSRGLFASGKFDQLKRDVPYATLAQAFQSLIRQLLGKPEAELAEWRDQVRRALNPNGALVVDLIPELKFLIGEQQPVAEVPPAAAKARVQMTLRRLIGVFARATHPLALFLDDLQWLDGATLDLLENILVQNEPQQLLLVGAYRDNEVDAAHPLMRKLSAIRESGAVVHEIELGPLEHQDLAHWFADALRCPQERALPLAQLVHEKTAGNPYFASQFLQELVEDDLISFEPKNLIERSVILTTGSTLNVSLPARITGAIDAVEVVGNFEEQARIVSVLRETKGRISGPGGAALRLGVKRSTLLDRMKKVGIDAREVRNRPAEVAA